MNILTKHLLNHFLGLTLWSALLMLVLVWVMQSLRFLDLVINKGFGIGTFLTFTGYLIPKLMTFVLPLAVFAGACALFKRLNDENELTPLLGAGLSPRQVVRPLLIAGVLLAVLSYANGLYLMPVTQTAFKELQFNLRHTQSHLFLEENRFNQIDDNLMVYIDMRTSQKSMRGLLVHDTRKPDAPVTWLAQSGEMIVTADGFPQLKLMNGVRQDADTAQQSMVSFSEQILTIDHELPNLGERSYALEEYDLRTLAHKAETHPNPNTRNEAKAELYKRLLWPLNIFAMILIAAVFLLVPKARRHGVGRPLMASIVIGIGYQLSLFWLESLAAEGYIFGLHGMWLWPVIVTTAGFLLLGRRPN